MTSDRRPTPRLTPVTFRSWSQTSPQAVSRPLGVLVVDQDGVTRKFVQTALGKEKDIRVELARDATSALELLQSTMFDVVIVDTELPEMPGLRFLTLLRSEVRYRHVAFVFLTADRTVDTKVALLNAGADDVLEKPQDPQVLRARVRSVAERRRSVPSETHRDRALWGSFGVLALPDVVSLFELSRRTGRLLVTTPRASGELHFHEGSVVFTNYGNLAGVDAFYAMIVEPEGEFSFDATEPDLEARNIFGTTAALILDAARRLDEGIRHSIVPPAAAPVEAARGSYPPPAPSGDFARTIEGELSNELSLGELRLWSGPELEKWTRARIGEQRFHMVLFAPLHVAVASVMAITAPPTERLMLSALATGEKVIGASFRMRKGQVVDLVACDIRSLEDGAPHLRRCPDAAILYAPGGNYQNLAPQHQDNLDEVLVRLCPTLILAVGTLDLQSRWFEMRAVRKIASEIRALRSGQSPDELDLRFVMRSAVTLWGGLAP